MLLPYQSEKRGARRCEIEFPLGFRGGQGMTRNISSSGALFATLEPFELRRRFNFTLLPFHAPPMHGLAEVVRTVELADHYEVAVTFMLIAVVDSSEVDGSEYS